MATAGPNSPGTVVSDASIGTVAWATPSNATASENTRTTATLGASAVSQYLKATNFGFAIPSGATIDGIQAEVEHSMSTLTGGVRASDSSVKLVQGGVIGGTDLATNVTLASTTDAYKSYGGATSLWGRSWAYTDINATDFGVATSYTANTIGGTPRVDHIRITVYYTAGGASFIAQRNALPTQAVRRAGSY